MKYHGIYQLHVYVHSYFLNHSSPGEIGKNATKMQRREKLVDKILLQYSESNIKPSHELME